MLKPLRVLMVEDSASDEEILVRELTRAGFAPTWVRVETEEEFLGHLGAEVDIVLSDQDLPHFSGVRALQLLKMSGLRIPFVIVSGAIGEEFAVEAMREGAADYLLKDRLARLGPAVSRALDDAVLRRERERLETRLAETAASAPGVIFALRRDLDGLLSFPYVSPKATELLGLEPRELRRTSEPFFQRVLGADLDRLNRALTASFSEGGPLNVDFRIRTGAGSLVWLALNAITRRELDGSMILHGFAHDVSAQKIAGEALRESEERFHAAFANNPAGIILTSFEAGVALEVNDSWLAICRTTREEIVGKPVRWLWPTADHVTRFLEALATKRVLSLQEQEFVRGDGSVFVAEYSSQLLEVQGKNCILTTLVDITERKRGQQQLQARRRRSALLAGISQRLVVSADPLAQLDGIFREIAGEMSVDVFANYMVSPPGDRLVLVNSGGLDEEQRRAFAEIAFGESLCGVVAKTRRPVSLVDLASSSMPEAAGVAALGVKTYAGHPLIANGRLLGTISFGSRSRDAYEEEEIQLVATVAVQVAAAVERMQLLKELRLSNSMFQLLAQNIQEVFWVTDAAKERVHFVSPGYERVWGRSREALYAQPAQWFDAVHPDDRARVRAASLSRQALGRYDETYRIVRPDGTVRWVRDRAYPAESAPDAPPRIVGVAEDITERRELEQQFLHAQRLEAIGTLSSGIAHDLNNILAPMLMIAPLLRGKLSNPRDGELLTLVEQSARRGADIIKQLLTFSRGIDGNRGPVQLRHLVKEMTNIMRETFPRSLKIVEHTPENLWIVTADATQLHQVLMNLCVNARDAMTAGGVLTLSAENVRLAENDPQVRPDAPAGTYVAVTVRDTGHGIPPEALSRIFEPFFTTKEIGKGTGLGLSTVIGIVKSHRGFVRVESSPGAGSAFRVFLPATPSATEKPMSPPATSELGRQRCVLVADDEWAICGATRAILELHDYRVLTALNGADALKQFLLNRGSVRLVLTDVMMPLMNGVELIRAVRDLEPAMRFVATTGLSDPDAREQLAALGVTEVLTKPCKPEEILQAVGNQLSAAQVA